MSQFSIEIIDMERLPQIAAGGAMSQFKVTVQRAWHDRQAQTIMDALIVADGKAEAAIKALAPFCPSDDIRDPAPLVITVVSVL